MNTWYLLLAMNYLSQVMCFECNRRDFGNDKIVCVCNATFCGSFGMKMPDAINDLEEGQFKSYTSSKSGLRFQEETGYFETSVMWKSADIHRFLYPTIAIDRSVVYQTITGLGGSFTDATGINLKSLSGGARNNLMQSYFSDHGLQYSIGRVPIGGSDFSTYPYTYDDDHPDDFNLTYFSLKQEDYDYKIPFIRQAEELIGEQLKLIASPWSAPSGMKTNGEIIQGGYLRGSNGGLYYQTWANYFIKFLDAYEENNITIWAVTPENEPVMGKNPFYPFNSMGFTALMERDFIKFNLGPTLENSPHNAVKIIIFDDQRTVILHWISKVLSDPEAAKYTSGIGFHWYFNSISPASVLSKIHDKYPDKFIISTEACSGFLELDPSKRVIIGSWERGEAYAKDIIQNFQNWAVAWIDWNMALDETGGPNWADLRADSPILVNSMNDEFYQQPMFFALGHFSKFVRPGAKRIHLEMQQLPLSMNAVAFEGPGNVTSVIIQNTGLISHDITLYDPSNGYLRQRVPADSIVSVIWKNVVV